MSKLMAYSGESMTDPNKGLQPMKTAAMDNINRNYMDAPNQVATQMARRGYGSSGEMGNSMYKVALGRAGAMSDLESNFAQMALQKQNEGATIGQNLLQMGRGVTGTGTSPDMSLSNGLMSAGNGLGNIATMLMMSKILKT